jgi:Na+-translocating ferredoxin:NAD+ oxidoreductase subunit D
MNTAQIMRQVLLALIPGLAVQVYFFGYGFAFNVAVALATALAAELAATRLRGRDLGSVRDGSALVTGTLIALALPPAVSPVIVATATALGLALGKHVYGGLGANPFNPAMVGYAIVLVSFPRALADWPSLNASAADALTGATPLEQLAHRGGQTVAEVWQASAGFGHIAGIGWEWINVAYLAGGAWLVARRLIDWRIPVAMLVTIGVLAALTYDAGGSASHGSPTFHWFSGGTMLVAFFIATDPVTGPTTRTGRAIYGVLIGAITFAVRAAGAYPDGLAFAVLLGNAAAPMIDHLTLRVRRHRQIRDAV